MIAEFMDYSVSELRRWILLEDQIRAFPENERALVCGFGGRRKSREGQQKKTPTPPKGSKIHFVMATNSPPKEPPVSDGRCAAPPQGEIVLSTSTPPLLNHHSVDEDEFSRIGGNFQPSAPTRFVTSPVAVTSREGSTRPTPQTCDSILIQNLVPPARPDFTRDPLHQRDEVMMPVDSPSPHPVGGLHQHMHQPTPSRQNQTHPPFLRTSWPQSPFAQYHVQHAPLQPASQPLQEPTSYVHHHPQPHGLHHLSPNIPRCPQFRGPVPPLDDQQAPLPQPRWGEPQSDVLQNQYPPTLNQTQHQAFYNQHMSSHQQHVPSHQQHVPSHHHQQRGPSHQQQHVPPHQHAPSHHQQHVPRVSSQPRRDYQQTPQAAQKSGPQVARPAPPKQTQQTTPRGTHSKHPVQTQQVVQHQSRPPNSTQQHQIRADPSRTLRADLTPPSPTFVPIAPRPGDLPCPSQARGQKKSEADLVQDEDKEILLGGTANFVHQHPQVTCSPAPPVSPSGNEPRIVVLRPASPSRGAPLPRVVASPDQQQDDAEGCSTGPEPLATSDLPEAIDLSADTVKITRAQESNNKKKDGPSSKPPPRQMRSSSRDGGAIPIMIPDSPSPSRQRTVESPLAQPVVIVETPPSKVVAPHPAQPGQVTILYSQKTHPALVQRKSRGLVPRAVELGKSSPPGGNQTQTQPKFLAPQGSPPPLPPMHQFVFDHLGAHQAAPLRQVRPPPVPPMQFPTVVTPLPSTPPQQVQPPALPRVDVDERYKVFLNDIMNYEDEEKSKSVMVERESSSSNHVVKIENTEQQSTGENEHENQPPDQQSFSSFCEDMVFGL
jgi:hypothetical protein